MNRIIIFCFIVIAITFTYFKASAQVKIGDNPTAIKTASLLELESTNKGLVMPRVSLSGSITSPAPLNADILPGTIVYNTNSAFIGGIGLQIWTGNTWMVVTPTSLSSNDAWKLTGNGGTNPSVNFIGTTDGQPLVFKVNGQQAGRINYSGTAANTSFGYQALAAGADAASTAFGYQALYNNTTGYANVASGYQSLYSNTTGGSNVANGYWALYHNSTGAGNIANGMSSLWANTTGSFNVANGYMALSLNTQGNGNVANGFNALFYNTTGNYNTASGSYSLPSNTTGSYNAANGYYSLYLNTTGEKNTANGSYTLVNNITGSNNVANGYAALISNTIGSSNTAIGNGALFGNAKGNYNTSVGYNADVSSDNLSNATAIGSNAIVTISNALVLGDSVNNVKIGIGTGSPTANFHAKGTVRFENLTSGLLTTDASGNVSTTPLSFITGNYWGLYGNSSTNAFNFIGTTDEQPLVFKANNQLAGRIDYLFSSANTSFGYQALYSNTTGILNVANGYRALLSNTTGYQNVANGPSALFRNTIGYQNIANGNSALLNNTSGHQNVANGAAALLSNTTGNENVANGNNALAGNITGNYNTANGSSALISNQTGSNNTATGYKALFNNYDGSYNTALGFGANVSSASLTNATAIGANAMVDISNAIVLGNTTDGVKVGIGTSSPTANLHVKGTVRFESITNGVLTADASGNLSTTTLPAINASNWSLTGNTGTNPSTNFIGTNDAQPLVFKVSGQKAGRIDYSGAQNTSFGYQALNSIGTGTNNAANGFQSLLFNTGGSYNTANGSFALANNTTGSYNTANGALALFSNSIASNNTATGLQALRNNTAGTDNVANGFDALMNNTNGNYNVAAGSQAMITNSAGSYNTANGAYALATNTAGNYNTAIGYNALKNSGGDGNTAVGYAADVTGNTLTNATAIGYNAKVAVSNAIVLGNNAAVGIGTSTPGTNAKVEIVGNVSHALSDYNYVTQYNTGHQPSSTSNISLYTSDAIWCGGFLAVTSDMRTKTNIVTSGSSNNLSLINKLRVVNYNYKDKIAKGTSNITGFLAQEVEKVMPDAVTRNKGVVPDIYQNATGIKYDSAAKILTLSLKEAAAIKAGDTVKLITDAGEQLAHVASVHGNTITVSNWASNCSWVFVYGKQVNDLRNLDYNKIFSAGIGAIQELSEQNDELKKQNNDIQNQNTSMQQDIDTLKAQMKMLMDKMNTTAKSN